MKKTSIACLVAFWVACMLTQTSSADIVGTLDYNVSTTAIQLAEGGHGSFSITVPGMAEPYSGVQFAVQLPEGATISTVGYNFDANTAPPTSPPSNAAKDTYYFSCYSFTNTFTGAMVCTIELDYTGVTENLLTILEIKQYRNVEGHDTIELVSDPDETVSIALVPYDGSHEPSPTPSPEPEATPSPTPSPEPEATPSPTPSPEQEVTPSPTPSSEPEATPSPEPTSSPTPTPSPEPEATPTPTPSQEPEATPSPEPTSSPTPTPSPEPEATPSPEPTSSPSPTPTPSPSSSPTPSPSPTSTPTPTPSSSPTPSPTPGPTPTSIPSVGAGAAAYPSTTPAPYTSPGVAIPGYSYNPDGSLVANDGTPPLGSAGTPSTAPTLDMSNDKAYLFGYPDGLFNPDADITRAEAASMLYALTTNEDKADYAEHAMRFSDIDEDDWYLAAVGYFTATGTIFGYPDGTFGGDMAITRAEFAAILSRLGPAGAYGDQPFTDIELHWARGEILAAYSDGWVFGYPDGTFMPDANITRAEAVAMVNRMVGRDLSLYEGYPMKFSDVHASQWYYMDIVAASNDRL